MNINWEHITYIELKLLGGTIPLIKETPTYSKKAEGNHAIVKKKTKVDYTQKLTYQINMEDCAMCIHIKPGRIHPKEHIEQINKRIESSVYRN